MARTHLVLSLTALIACTATNVDPITDIDGTWGGENAGLIATDTVAHVHIGCTLGYAKKPIVIKEDGSFEATGTYNVDAYPIDRGIIHPARFSGRISGRTMTLTVVLTDDGRKIGPVSLVLGKEPVMGPCPICRTAEWGAAQRQLSILRSR
jgi:hypothetical protein